MKGQPTYKENQDNAKNAWCRLVEKAFAKYHGHYRDVKEMKGMSFFLFRKGSSLELRGHLNLNSSKATNALEALTGRKSQKYSVGLSKFC